MNRINTAFYEFREMDELAAQESAIHSLHPLTKLVITVVYIIAVVSFDKYDFSGLAVMVLYPIIMFQISGIQVRTCFYKLRIVMPLVCAVGLINPFLDQSALLSVGNVLVSGGVVSMITLMLKGIFSLMAAFILAATTSMDAICAALRKIHVPGILVTLLLLTYRYIAVMLNEIAVMTDAYHLRAPYQKGIHISAWGSFLGQLLLRSMDRAEELYQSMQLRGFRDEFHYADTRGFTARSAMFMVLCLALIVAARCFNVSYILGNLLV